MQFTKNQTQRTIRQLFNVSQKLIAEQTENQGISVIGWHEGRMDTSHTDERQSGVNSGKHWETCCGSNEGDTLPKFGYRIQGLPHSTVEHEDHTRKEVVNKLISSN